MNSFEYQLKRIRKQIFLTRFVPHVLFTVRALNCTTESRDILVYNTEIDMGIYSVGKINFWLF